MELSSLVFSATTTELERASTVIAALVQDMSQVSVASANMARISAQTEAILARAANDSAKARKENAKAADIEIKTVIAADKADVEREKQVRKTTEAVEKATTATKENVSILQRQSDIYEFLAAGFSKGQSSILATAKASGQLSDELKKVLEAQKQFTSDSFDQSETGLKRLLKTTKEVTDANRFFLEGFDLTTKQARELSNDLNRLNASLAAQGKSYQEITNAQAIYKQQFIDEAAVVNKANTALDAITKQRREVVTATDYMTQAEQKLTAALNTANGAIDRSGTDSLVKYETALRKSGVTQDVATQKLAAYKAQLVQVQGQEMKRAEMHLARSSAPQLTDIAVSLYSGQAPLTVMLQQSGQLSDLLRLSGVEAARFGAILKDSFYSMIPVMKEVGKGLVDLVSGMFVDAGKGITSFVGNVTGISTAFEIAKRHIVAGGEANFKYIATLERMGSVASSVTATGIAALLVLLVAMAVEYKKIIQSENELSKALAVSGGTMGMSKDQAVAYAESMQSIGIGTLRAMDALTVFTKTGKMAAEGLDVIIKSALDLEKYAGVPLEETAKLFAKLQDEPTKALVEFAASNGQVSKSVLDTVSSLEQQGEKTKAVELATEAANAAMKLMSGEAKGNLSPIEVLWNDIGTAVGKVKQEIYNITTSTANVSAFRTAWETVAVVVSETWFVLKGVGTEIRGIAAQLVAVLHGDFAGAVSIGEMMKTDAQAARVEHDKLIASIMNRGDVENKQFNEKKSQNSEYASWLKDNEKALAKSQSKEEQFAIKKKQLQADLKKDLIDEVKYNEALAGWKRVIMGEDKKPKAAPKDTFYDSSMTKFRDAAIAATDASKELTKSQIELMQTVADPKFAGLSEQKKLDILQSGAAAIAIEKQKEAVIDLQKAEEFRDKILGKSEGLGKDYYAQMEALPKHAASLKLTTEQTDELIRKIYQGTPVWQKYNKSLEQADEALRKFTESSIAYQASTNAENQELDHRISLLGKTAEEQRKLQIEYQREVKINTARVELEKKLRDIAKDKAKAEKDGIVDTKKLKEFTDAEVQARQDAAERIKVINKGVAVEYASDLDKEIAAIRGGISDSIVTALFEGGKEGSKKLRSVLVDALRKKVTIVVDAVVNTLVGNVIGSITGAAGAGQAGSSALGLVGNASALYSAGSGLYAGFASAASEATLGAAFVGPSATAAGGAVGIGANIGAALKAIPGWGWALAGIALLAGSGIGSTRGANHGGGLYSSLGQTNQEAASQLTGKLGWKDPEEDFTKRGNTELNKQVESTVKGLLELYNGLGKLASGTVKELEVVAGFATNSKYDDEESYGYFQILEKATGELLKEYTNRDMDKDGGKAWEQYVADLGTAMVTELRSSDIPSWMDGILKELGDAPTLESFQKAVVEIHKIDQAFSMFSKNIDGFAGMTDKSFEALMKASGGIDTLSGSLNSYYENFYTEEERMTRATASLTEELAKSGVTMPATRDAYREMVTAALNAGEGGAELAAKLIQLSPAFAGITPAAATASKQLATLNKIISNFGLKTNLKDVNFTDATKTLFESFGVAVEDYSNSIAGVIQGVITGKIKAEDAGKELADAAVGGITNAIAQGASQAIAAQFVSSIISPVIANIMAGKTALDGIDMQAGLDNLKNSTDALKTVLNTIGPELADAFSGLGGIISSAADGAIAAVGTNQYGGVGDSRFAIGGSATGGGVYSPELQTFGTLASETIESNRKVSELLQKLLNPEKLFENRYKELDSKLADKRNERFAPQGWQTLGGFSTLNDLPGEIQAAKDEIAAFEEKLAEWKTQGWDNYDGPESVLASMKSGLAARITALNSFEKELREWYLAQARVIAVEDMATLAGETKTANEKTAELKRTGGLEDPITKLKESFGQKLKGINEGINSALQEEIDARSDTLPDAQSILDKFKNSGQWSFSESELLKAKELFGNDVFSKTRQDIAGGMQSVIDRIKAEITDLTEEQQTYLDSLNEWYAAQKELLSTEMLVDINNQIKALETEEKGPLTTIKDAIQKYIDDFTELGTLNDEAKAKLEKLSGLQLTKARKSLYDQLLSPEEITANAKAKLQTDFGDVISGALTSTLTTGLEAALTGMPVEDTSSLVTLLQGMGTEMPTTVAGFRSLIDSIDTSSQAGINLRDSLLQLIPGFIALQDGADGAGDALSKLRSDTDDAYAALERAVEAQRKVLNDLITNLRAVFDAAKNAAKNLYNEVTSVKKQSAAAGNAFIDQALQDLKNSGVIPDGVKLQDAIDSSMKGLSSEVYDSAFEEQRGRLILAGKLTTIADLTEPQLTLAEKQLKDLDAILETARAQIDELRGINTSVLSVATAISNLAAAIAAEKATVVQPVHQTGGVNPYPWKDTGSGGGNTDVVGVTKTNAERTIASLYQQVLGREADTAGLQWYLDNYSSGGNLTVDANTFENILSAGKTGSDLTGFDVGINNVPYDMPAYLHAGESVIPSEFNPFNPNAVSPLSLVPASNNAPVQQDNSEIIEENRLLRQELQAQNGAMVRLLSKVARVVERWDGDGMPEARTTTA